MADKRFGLHDKAVSFFKDKLPPDVDDKLAAMTVDLMRSRQFLDCCCLAWAVLRKQNGGYGSGPSCQRTLRAS
ncbi:hypothetical protein FNJ47_47685 [Bradyrhizobium sp. UFLA 03-164]|uniref:Uncharacterized protein n=2 Tax=Bradyrhizobium uaiense TaxID=2594946 RepID=A0A6P1C0H4_9BRAD|nr:hypothetical protein [Bradyrhizobium uaiense]